MYSLPSPSPFFHAFKLFIEGKKNSYLIKTWISIVNMNYFYTKLDINLCQTRLKSKVVINCAILDNYDLGFLNHFSVTCT